MADIDFTPEDLNPDLPKIGWVCTYTPEEVIQAAGFHPFRILEDNPSTRMADTYLHHNLCPYARRCLDFGLKGEDRNLKGIVVAHSCDAMRSLFQSWQHYVPSTPFVHFLNVPKDSSPLALDFFTQEVQKLRHALEAYSGRKLEDSALWEAVDLFNSSRDLLRELYTLRKVPDLPLRGKTVYRIIQASQTMPKKDFNQKLKNFIEEIKKERGQTSQAKGPRIVIMGSLLASSQLVEVIEGAGARVVCDDLCSGSRYFEGNIKKAGEAIRAISERYLLKAPCARMKDTRQRLERGKKLIVDCQVDGIIYQTVKFCDNHLYDFPIFREYFEKENVPVLQIEEDFSGGNIGQIKTRVEAFIEML